MPPDALRAVARLALLKDFSDQEIDSLVAAFSLARVRAQMSALGLCEPDASDVLVARLYFGGRCGGVSPNDHFDEAWYVAQHDDVRAAIRSTALISGFVHFIKDGLRAGRWPNQVLFAAAAACAAPGPVRDAIDADRYLARNPAARAFIAAFPGLTPLAHYNAYGRFLGCAADAEPPIVAAPMSLALRAAEAEFDPEFYAARYLTEPACAAYRQDPFTHYVTHGMRLGHSPNAWFQEDWYRAFYKEVRDAIAEGWLPSGFYHYVISGRGEGRLPRYDLTAALEARLPGLTHPSLLSRAAGLRNRVRGLAVLPRCTDGAAATRMIWLMLPMLNPDIIYGGYRAALELVCALLRDGHRVTIVTTEESPNKEYFLWGETSARIRAAFADLPIIGLDTFCRGTIGAADLFIAYAVWDLRACAQLAALTDNPKPLLLLQEYEPVFHDNGAQRALCEACYRIPHYPIINSRFLLAYLERHAIGVFGQPRPAQPRRDYAVFEHKVNILPAQTAGAMAARSRRVLAVYARPEAHAGRNLFEMALIALQELCARGVFGPQWSFIGVGALSNLPPVPLGGGHELVLKQKLPEDEYRRMMGAMDIGISLMYAPHPSVMPFEFATTGALVVTNTYENRSAAQLRAISGNILPCELTIDSLCAAIEAALARVPDTAARALNAYRPDAESWDQIFAPPFIAGVIDAVAEPHEAVVVDFPPGRAASRPKLVPRKKARRSAARSLVS
jgi:hypothetical protein